MADPNAADRHEADPHHQAGSVPVVVAIALTIGTLLALVLADLGVVMIARRTATSAAEASALAAAGALHPQARGTPAVVAAQVAAANGARLVTCRCRRPVTTTVEVAIDSRLLHHFGIRQVTATAHADLWPGSQVGSDTWRQEFPPQTAKLSRGSLVGPWATSPS
jgi:predicted nucleic acid-binding protein